jgi:L-fuculose-phosphate aldolase
MPQFQYTSIPVTSAPVTSASLTSAPLTYAARLIAAARGMAALGLATGTAGNLSLRDGGQMLITPSALPFAGLTPEMLPRMDLAGPYGVFMGAYRPSSEWRFHADIYAAYPKVNAIVHHHAPYATALAMARREIPACHYMVARFGGAPIACAPYALFGSADLSTHVVAALAGRSACLMANHGALVTSDSIEAALAAAAELEALARHYALSLTIGGPVLLSAAEIDAATAQFATAYGPNVPC